MASIPKEFNIQEDTSVVSDEAKIKALQEGMIKRIGDETHKQQLEVLAYNLGILQENLRLLNSIRSVEDLKSCDITLRENSSQDLSNLFVLDQKKSERLINLQGCFSILEDCSQELKDFRNKLMQQSKHVLNDLSKSDALKELLVQAIKLLSELLLTPQVFNPRVQALIQPLADFLYLFNKMDVTIPHILQAFEKVKIVVRITHELCESEWSTFSNTLVDNANDVSIGKESFNGDVERILNGLMAKEISIELKRKISEFKEAAVGAVLDDLAYIAIFSKEQFKKMLNTLYFNKVLTKSERAQLEKDLDTIFRGCGTEKSINRDAKKIILDVLKYKYLGDLKNTYFAAFMVLKLLKLKIEKNEDGISKLSDPSAIDKVDACVSYLMERNFSSKANHKPYYSSRANPENSEIEEIARDLIKVKIDLHISIDKTVTIREDENTPKTYIEQLEECKDEKDGVVDLQKLFDALFADYSQRGLFLFAHPLRHHRNRVDEIRGSVKKITENDKEIVDWYGVLTALETWPDKENMAYEGSLRKRICFFRKVIEQIDNIKEAPVAHSSCSLLQ